MILDLALWAFSILITANIAVQSLESGPFPYWVFFTLLVQLVFLWEHGVKRYLRGNRKAAFAVFYALPVLVSASLVLFRLISR